MSIMSDTWIVKKDNQHFAITDLTSFCFVNDLKQIAKKKKTTVYEYISDFIRKEYSFTHSDNNPFKITDDEVVKIANATSVKQHKYAGDSVFYLDWDADKLSHREFRKDSENNLKESFWVEIKS